MSKVEIKPVPKDNKKKEQKTISVVALAKFEPPDIKYNKNEAGLVFLGNKNLFYEDLVKYREDSPTNGAIISGIAGFIAGRGMKIKRSDNEASDKAMVSKLFPFKEVKRVAKDYATFGEGAFLVIKAKDEDNVRINKCVHIERDILAPFINEKGEIVEYWADPNKKWLDKSECDIYKVFDPSEARKNNKTEIIVIRDYQAGRNYISLPEYIQGLNYAILESKIAIYSVNHISRGFSAGWVVNFNNGVPKDQETKEEIERGVKDKFTGEEVAGNVIISFNNNKEVATTVDAIEQNTSHEQWQFWTGEARTQIMVSHRVTSPQLFGIKDGSGLGNNAEELETAFELYMKTVVEPIQLLFLDEMQSVLSAMEISTELEFDPLLSFVDAKTTDEEEIENTPLKDRLKFSKNEKKKLEQAQSLFTDELIALGEDEDLDEYELIAVAPVTDPNDMQDVNNVSLAKTFASFWKWASEQDNELFKVRYAYAPNKLSDNSRSFCKKMIGAGKVYRKEDIVSAEDKVVNKGFGLRGADTYSIWLYKGGVYCQHFWERRIYLKKNNSKITVSEARKMIMDIEPSERDKYRLQVNDPRVAQVAEAQNNWWRVTRFKKALQTILKRK